MSPVDRVLDRRDYYETKSSGNPQQDQRHILQTNPLNYDLYYARPQMKFYKLLSNDFQIYLPQGNAFIGKNSFQTAHSTGDCK